MSTTRASIHSRFLAVFFCTAAFAACDDAGEDPDPDSAPNDLIDSGTAPQFDADVVSTDASPGAADASARSVRQELVGIWERRNGADVVKERLTMTAEGAITMEWFNSGKGQQNDVSTGTFTADETRLYAETQTSDGQAVNHMFTYYVNDTYLVWSAGLPISGHDGIVGHWMYDLRIDGLSAPGGDVTSTFGGLSEYEFRADGTATRIMTPHDGSPMTTIEGRWENPDELVDDSPAGPNDYRFFYEAGGGTVGLHFSYHDDAVLGPNRTHVKVQ